MISANIESVRERIAAASRRAGRRPEDVTLVAVSKTFPAERIREVVRAGVSDIGENYVQELLPKRDALAGEPVRWHFIGHLQTNKAKSVAAWVTMVHALDSQALAQELDTRAARANRTIDALVEVNTTGELSKFGIAPDQVLPFVRSLEGFSHIRICGLMTIGPFLPDPEGSRPMFRRLRELRETLARHSQENLDPVHLSMGMTGDFEVAVEEGATLLRIGTALFGSRPKRS
ncbi:MAG: YggS family pyridoxal phosphate-dependent enzyme [Bacteroidetes bacterium]|nr:YggS family pyridoxal phosphate-dependent enzyme [Bacteroidota bacterium]